MRDGARTLRRKLNSIAGKVQSNANAVITKWPCFPAAGLGGFSDSRAISWVAPEHFPIWETCIVCKNISGAQKHFAKQRSPCSTPGKLEPSWRKLRIAWG